MRWSPLLVVLLLAGCTDDPPADDNGTADPPADDGSSTDPPGTGTDPPQEPEPEPEPRDPVTWHVVIEGNQFVEGSLEIQVGDTVHWMHQDSTTPHTVTATDDTFHSGDCPGTTCMTEFTTDTFEHVFDEVGEFEYFCQVHTNMRETITVLAVSPTTP